MHDLRAIHAAAASWSGRKIRRRNRSGSRLPPSNPAASAAARRGVIDQRFDSKRVAREQEIPGAMVANGEGKHSAEMIHACGSPAGVGLQNDFGVGSGAECAAVRLENRAQRGVVVDFAVERDGVAAAYALHGLPPASPVDDGKPPVSERHPGPAGEPFPIRTAVRELPGHGADLIEPGPVRIGGDHSRYAAHGFPPPAAGPAPT